MSEDPDVVVPRSLLVEAVDLTAHVWNALVWMPTREDPKNGWDYFFNRLHRLREAVNQPGHEQLRALYAASFPYAGRATEVQRRPTIDESWRIVQPEDDPAVDHEPTVEP